MSVETLVVPTPKSKLPQHNGRPVPWITRWSGEVDDTPMAVSYDEHGIYLNYRDGRENREASGVLWKREGIGRHGEPQYSQVNTYRQRAAMDKRLCQVCGSKINERPIRWLLAKQAFNPIEEGKAATFSPPTCSSCIPLALELCPYLKREGWMIVKVLEYKPWGVYGEAVHVDPETKQARDLKGIYVPYENPPVFLTATVAFQRVVQLTKFTIEEESENGTWKT